MSTLSYGGWLPQRGRTGDSISFSKVCGLISVTALAFTTIGTGSQAKIRDTERFSAKIHNPTSTIENNLHERRPEENLAQIRKILSPSISELATTLGVTRQSIYNWSNGEAITIENSGKLRDLASAADVFARAGIRVDSMLLKRKFSHGRNLLEVVQAGESATGAASVLVQILKRESEQRERMNARFSSREKTASTGDFDLPAAD